jgi:hypothetical protein
MNKNTRTACIEVLLNESELSRLDEVRGGLGRSPYFRNLLHLAARLNGMRPRAGKESRVCPGGRVASRASLGMRRQV